MSAVTVVIATQADVEEHIKGLLTQGPIKHGNGGAFNALYNLYSNASGAKNAPKTRRLLRSALNALERKGEIALRRKGPYNLYSISLPDAQASADSVPREFETFAKFCTLVLATIQLAAKKARAEQNRRHSVRLDLQAELELLGTKHDILEARHYLGLLGLVTIAGVDPARYNVSERELDHAALRALVDGPFTFSSYKELPMDPS